MNLRCQNKEKIAKFAFTMIASMLSLHGHASESIAIIGGGLAGTIAALHLADQGEDVDLYEKGDDLFERSSAIPAHLYTGIMYADFGEDTIRHIMRDGSVALWQ